MIDYDVTDSGGFMEAIIAIIVFLVWLYGNMEIFDSEFDFGAAGALALLIDIALVIYVIYFISQLVGQTNEVNTPQEKNELKKTIRQQNKTKEQKAKKRLLLNNEYLNTTKTNKYMSFLKRISDLENELNRMQSEKTELKNEYTKWYKKAYSIKSFCDKPWYVTKRKYLQLNQSALDECNNKLSHLSEKIDEIDETIVIKRQKLTSMKFHITDEITTEFTALISAFSKWKNSDNLQGSISKSFLNLNAPKDSKDLKYLTYNITPILMIFDDYKVYFFPNSIWVFNNECEFIGVYKSQIISSSFALEEKRYLETKVFSDTKIVTKQIPHNTWLHTCKDGSPDLRYSNNPVQTYYTEEKYYLVCTHTITICGKNYIFQISSYDNCISLDKAIKAYNQSFTEETLTYITDLLCLIKKCSSSDVVSQIENDYYNMIDRSDDA